MGGEIKRFVFAPLPVDYYFIFFNLSNRLKAPIASQRSGKKKSVKVESSEATCVTHVSQLLLPSHHQPLTHK